MRKAYNTEILSVGTELLLGHITNTDARDVSELLSKIGVNVRYHTVVGDNPQRLRECVEIAKKRADVIITTGGLGPTCDDLTKQTVCAALGVDLYYDRRAEEELRSFVAYILMMVDNALVVHIEDMGNMNRNNFIAEKYKECRQFDRVRVS